MNSVPASRAALLRVLAAGLPPPGSFPLRDQQPEAGLFGPRSATWEVMREPLLILGAARALLMQSAHPLVAQGALDHSDFAKDPIGRFQRTAGWVSTVVFGTTEEAQAAIRGVNRVHRKVQGDLPEDHATSAWAPGTAYHAQDQLLLLWVHASLIDAMLTTYRAVVGAISTGQGDRFVREWDAVAKLMGLTPGTTWTSESQMRGWIERQLRSGVALPGPGSRLVASVILAPGVRGPVLAKLTSLITAGMLPPRVRDRFEIRWSPVHEAAYRVLTGGLRSARPALPRALRVAPTYEFAMARVTGELLRGSARTERLLSRLRAA
ncbi:MAG: oxygenase MpaB family protein [Candidatus Dormiibacterota bacterium]